MVQSTKDILEERGTRYGVFMGQARIAQSLHIVLRQGMEMSGKNTFDFAPDELEAVHMIVNKLARIYNGDPHYSDSWRDIAGYATLVADRLDNDTQEQKLIEDKMNNEQRNGTDAGTDRSSNEGQDTNTEATGTPTGDDNRPTGQPKLRRLPVRLQVNDGFHRATSETQPTVPGAPGQ